MAIGRDVAMGYRQEIHGLDKQPTVYRGLNELAEEAHRTAVQHGWWGTERNFGEVIALIHSEASEALEDYRKGYSPERMSYKYKAKPGTQTVPMRMSGDDVEYLSPLGGWAPAEPAVMREFGYDVKPVGIPSEMADIIIRVLDACAAYGIDIEEAMRIKMAYNETRPYRHGEKNA
jgi:hypothetical protein